MDILKQKVEETGLLNKTDQVKNNVQILIQNISAPAIVYLAINIAVLSWLYVDGIHLSKFILNLVKVCLWGYCVNYISINSTEILGWIFVLIPYGVLVLQILQIIDFSTNYLDIFLSPEEQHFFKI